MKNTIILWIAFLISSPIFGQVKPNSLSFKAYWGGHSGFKRLPTDLYWEQGGEYKLGVAEGGMWNFGMGLFLHSRIEITASFLFINEYPDIKNVDIKLKRFFFKD